jgi:hypothetical protein
MSPLDAAIMHIECVIVKYFDCELSVSFTVAYSYNGTRIPVLATNPGGAFEWGFISLAASFRPSVHQSDGQPEAPQGREFQAAG